MSKPRLELLLALGLLLFLNGVFAFALPEMAGVLLFPRGVFGLPPGGLFLFLVQAQGRRTGIESFAGRIFSFSFPFCDWREGSASLLGRSGALSGVFSRASIKSGTSSPKVLFLKKKEENKGEKDKKERQKTRTERKERFSIRGKRTLFVPRSLQFGNFGNKKRPAFI